MTKMMKQIEVAMTLPERIRNGVLYIVCTILIRIRDRLNPSIHCFKIIVMITKLETVDSYIEDVKELVQFYCRAIQVFNNIDAGSELEFKTTLVRLLQLQCKLSTQRTLIELFITPTTTQALNIIGVRYIIREGQILITD